MRDLLPPKARFQSRVGSRIMRSFELFGYDRVWLPTFEYASVLERSHSAVGSSLRFVEPVSGEIVALRADMTPQVARVVSTRFRDAPLPARLCYQGSVLRRRRERARTESQVVQAGIELVGMPGLDGDFEVLAATCAAVREAGLEDFVLDLGHAGIAASLLADVDPSHRHGISEALSAKDAVVVSHRGSAAGLSGKALAALVELADLHGGPETLERAIRILDGTPAHACGLELQQLSQRVLEAELAPAVVTDFGETSRFGYYTGAMFRVLARGPGEPIASGGRYDNLYPRFGLERSAAGCALDVNNVCWALQAADWSEPAFPRLVADSKCDAALLDALRGAHVACAVTAGDLGDYAKSWGFDFMLRAGQPHTLSTLGGEAVALEGASASECASQVSDFIRRQRESTRPA